MALTIARGNPISFYDLNIAAGLSGTTANTSMAARGTTFSISYATNGTNSLEMCEFYTNGCPNTSTYPYNIAVGQVDTIGEQVTVWWTEAGSLPFTLASYKIWMKTNVSDWLLRQSDLSVPRTTWTDTSTQPGFDICYRVQAIGTGGQKSPSDADMILLGAYPPNDCVYTEDFTPTTV